MSSRDFIYDGEGAPVCRRCGALVPVGSSKVHLEWHDRLRRTNPLLEEMEEQLFPQVVESQK